MPEIDEPIQLSDYRDSWPAQFAAEQSRLGLSLGLSPEKFPLVTGTSESTADVADCLRGA
jgi:hypothetical protein